MASSNTSQKPSTIQPLLRAINKTNTFLIQMIFATFVCLYNISSWCAQQFFSPTVPDRHTEWAAQTGRDLALLISDRALAEEYSRKKEIGELCTRYESEIDFLREEINQMRAEMTLVKSSVITLRRAL